MLGHLFVATAVVCLVNGMFSPMLRLVIVLAPAWLPDFVTPSLSAVLFLGSLLLAVATLLVSGIPAALYERLVGPREGDVVSMTLWLATAVVLSLPGLFVAGSLLV